MSQAANYNILTSGNLVEGFDESSVTEEFCRLFKVEPEKASQFLNNPRTIKKNLTADQALAYQRKLQAIGLEVVLDPPMADAANEEFGGLSLTPVDEPATETGDQPAGPSVAPGNMSCPKCQSEQPEADECIHCGLIISKFHGQSDGAVEVNESTAAEPGSTQIQPRLSTNRASSSGSDGSLTPRAIAVTVGAAITGALLWKIVAVTTGMEFGLLAWLIGGMIGLAASFDEAEGTATGVLCALLAVLAIFGGKFLAYDSMLNEFTSTSAEELMMDEDYMSWYQMELAESREFAKVHDDEGLRQFMIDNDYTLATTLATVPVSDIEDFLTLVAPRLEALAQDNLSFEAWIEMEQQQLSDVDISAGSLVFQSLGLVDIVFLLLGVGTAFRLGRDGIG